MRKFDQIVAAAAGRKGGIAALDAIVAKSRPSAPEIIAAIPNDRILSKMTRCVFQAGFSWTVVDAKWDGFEAAFGGFEPHACAAMPEDRFDALLKDTRIVRNGAKIQSVIANARFVLDLAAARGSAGQAFADWPDADYIGLLEMLKTRASRLSGNAAMYFLRSIGKPSFIASRSVVTALIHEGVLTKPPSGKRDLRVIQDAFNQWAAQSGRDLTAISRILAMSIDEGR
jgi:3-methyladenine DNA glycosylase Tag